MTSKELKVKRQLLREGNRKASAVLVEIPRSEWPPHLLQRSMIPERVLRSKTFLVQEFAECDGAVRLSVARTELDKSGMWKDGLVWDELQRLKREAGYGECDAIEIFPADRDVVNVANMRHLWVLTTPSMIPFKWTRSRP